MNDGMGWAGWLMMSSLFLLCLVVVGALIYLVARASATTPGHGAVDGAGQRPQTAAERTLDERFARGEIDQPEYEQRKQALRGG